SLQLQVIANETIGFLRAATRGVTVNDETLALDVTEELGPTGSYLQHPHTIKHYKEPFYSKLFDKGGYAQWQKKGSLTMEARAAKVVDEILANYKSKALPEDVQQKIKAIVEREQAWINTKK
ncbi:MAG: trimethylamine methyltransferase family protein, partial [Desulfamplus sp.]|nr:trimethylamine methyltransferase family protein [Desulfamplus sp.]